LMSVSNFRGQRRKQANVYSTLGLMLDFDSKITFTHDNFAKIFPGLSYIAYNTWRSTKANPRFRVYVPTDTVMTAVTYKQVLREVISMLPKGSVDKAPTNAASAFFIPCQARDSEASFFHHQPGKALNVMSFVERARQREAYLEQKRKEKEERRKALGITNQKVSFLEVKNLLSRISADAYDAWFPVGRALYNEFGDEGYGLWIEWSKTSDKFNQVSADYQWDAIVKSPGSATMGTIFHLAGCRRIGLVQWQTANQRKSENQIRADGQDKAEVAA
jgi:hypothetical protein